VRGATQSSQDSLPFDNIYIALAVFGYRDRAACLVGGGAVPAEDAAFPGSVRYFADEIGPHDEGPGFAGCILDHLLKHA